MPAPHVDLRDSMRSTTRWAALADFRRDAASSPEPLELNAVQGSAEHRRPVGFARRTASRHVCIARARCPVRTCKHVVADARLERSGTRSRAARGVLTALLAPVAAPSGARSDPRPGRRTGARVELRHRDWGITARGQCAAPRGLASERRTLLGSAR